MYELILSRMTCVISLCRVKVEIASRRVVNKSRNKVSWQTPNRVFYYVAIWTHGWTKLISIPHAYLLVAIDRYDNHQQQSDPCRVSVT